jgi:hypothetical protein
MHWAVWIYKERPFKLVFRCAKNLPPAQISEFPIVGAKRENAYERIVEELKESSFRLRKILLYGVTGKRSTVSCKLSESLNWSYVWTSPIIIFDRTTFIGLR